MLFQPPLPPQYTGLTPEQMDGRIRAHRAAFGSRLVILGHHYQQDDVIQYADFTGDSLKLSQIAGQQKRAEFVIFCGVHFMAESADIICNGSGSAEGYAAADGADDPIDASGGNACSSATAVATQAAVNRSTGRREVVVILPDLSAGCSMADMAAIEQLEDAWDHLTSLTDATIVPITYVNSTAAVKSFVGKHGGACCTSSNARKVLEWALRQGDKVLFLPDQHLGRNTAYALGYPLDAMVVYDPHASYGDASATPVRGATPPLTDAQLRDAKFYLWKGHCSVHGLFTEKHVDEIRAKDPSCKVLVHPECKWEVVQKADLAGSTEYIIKTLEEAPAGSRWAVGTEMHLVNRLALKYAGQKSIRSLAGMQCLCTTMYRIDQKHLLWTLDELAAGRVVNRIRVDDDTRHWSLVALQRMLDNVPAAPIAAK